MTALYKIKNCFLLKCIAGEYVVVARGNMALEFNGTLVLNESCAVMWKKMEKYVSVEEIADEVAKIFMTDYKDVFQDVQKCVDKMVQYDLLEIKNIG